MTASRAGQSKKNAFGVCFLLAFFLTCFSNSLWADLGPVSRGVSGDRADRDKAEQWFDQFQEKLVSDRFEIHPRVRTEYELDSNVLLGAADERLDSVFREVPGAEVILPLGEHYIKADYQAELEQFMKTPNQNDENQYFKSEAALNFNDLYVKVNEGFAQTSSRAGTTFTERIPRFEHMIDAVVGMDFNQLGAEVGYEDFYRSYDSTPLKGLNYHSHKVHGRVLVDVTAKTQAFLEYALTGYNYFKDPSRDGTGQEIFGGVESQLLPKTKFLGKAGFERISHDESEDANNFVAEVRAVYQPTSKTRASLGYARSTEQSTFVTTTTLRQDVVFVNLRQDITKKLSGDATVSYARQDYNEPATTGAASPTGAVFVNRERQDDLFSSAVRLAYYLNDYVSLDAEYQYNRRDSNGSVFDYTDHVFVVGLSLEV